MGQIDRARDAEAALAHHLLENLLAALQAAVRREHGIQRDGTVGMEAHPVVREYRVRLRRQRGIGGDQHPHAGAPQCRGDGVELPENPFLGFAFLRRISDLLECIARRGLRIKPKLAGLTMSTAPALCGSWPGLMGAGMEKHYIRRSRSAKHVDRARQFHQG